MIKRFIHIVIILLVLDISLFAQVNNPQYSFRHYKTEHGLSNNWPFCLLEDDLGFIWVGTRDGLNRFDGYDFEVYDEENSSLENSYISALEKGEGNTIWVGTNSAGLYKYSWEGDNFKAIKSISNNAKTLSSNRISSLEESSDGVLWIGTNGGGLNSIDNDSLHVKRYDFGEECLRIMAIAIDKNDDVWIGSFTGLFHFERKTSQLRKITHADSIAYNLSDDRILSLHTDIVGRLWVGTVGSGLFYLDQDARQLRAPDIDSPELLESSIRKITSFPDGRIAIGTNDHGLVLVDPVSGNTQLIHAEAENANSLANNSVYDVMFDSFGSLWVANFSEGLNFYNKYDKKFSTISPILYKPNSLSNNNVRCFFQDKKSRIWIGTRAGLNLRLNNSSDFKTFDLRTGNDDEASSPIVLSMLEDSEGKLWIGTYFEGIRILDSDLETVSQFQHPDDINNALQHAHIYDLLEDKNKNIWMATMGGAYVLDSSGNDLKRYRIHNSNIANDQIRVMLLDSKGKVWLGTQKGLSCYNPDKKEFESYLTDDGNGVKIRNNHIFCLYEDDNGEIWAGTEGGGIKIINYENGIVQSIGKEDGLPDNIINAIEKDKYGKFWISTNKGLCRYDRAKDEVIVFSKEDGLQSDEFYPNSSLVTNHGEMYFGGYNGMNHFDPASILINPDMPKVLFTRLLLKNQEVNVFSEGTPLIKPMALTEKLKLTYKQNNISIHFAGIGYINPEKYQYAYYLEGFEEDWSPYSRKRVATYSNLNRGNYILKVKVKNNDNQTGEEVAELSITVLPTPWSSWLAYLIYIAIIVSLLLLYRRYVLAWASVKNELEFEKREKIQNEELNQMKLRFFTNISHEFRTPLTLLRGYIEKLSPQIKNKSGTNALEQVNKNSSRLLNLVDELMDFRKAESGLLKLKASKGDLVKYTKEIKEEFNELAEQQNIDFTFESQFPEYEVWFDPGKIEKILFNLISNAFKFTPSGKAILVSIAVSAPKPISNIKRIQSVKKTDPGWIEISVSDTGIGIPEKDMSNIFDRFFQVNDTDDGNHQQGTGIGLAFSKRLVDIHKGQLNLQSKPGAGSCFIIKLPLGKSYLSEDEILITDKERFYLRLNYRTKITETFGADQITDPSQDLAPGKPLVLVIEDNLQIINLLKDSLSETYNMIFAIDGQSGIDQVTEYNPDIIVTDLMMPGMTGIEVCDHLKGNPETSHIPIIILTAKTEEAAHVEGLKFGADAFLPKPFSAKLLIATIDNILANRLHLKEKFAAMDTIAPSDLARNKIDEQFLQKVISFIDNNLNDSSLDVVQLCHQLGMSRSVLYRKIKALTGHSIQEFIRGVRLRKAKHLLINTDKSISEVSYMVGFSNTKHFSTSFKKEFDLSPSEFRK